MNNDTHRGAGRGSHTDRQLRRNVQGRPGFRARRDGRGRSALTGEGRPRRHSRSRDGVHRAGGARCLQRSPRRRPRGPVHQCSGIHRQPSMRLRPAGGVVRRDGDALERSRLRTRRWRRVHDPHALLRLRRPQRLQARQPGPRRRHRHDADRPVPRHPHGRDRRERRREVRRLPPGAGRVRRRVPASSGHARGSRRVRGGDRGSRGRRPTARSPRTPTSIRSRAPRWRPWRPCAPRSRRTAR